MPMMGKFKVLMVSTLASYGDDIGLEGISRKDFYKTGVKSRRQESLGKGNSIKISLQGGKILHPTSRKSGQSRVASTAIFAAVDRF